MVMVFGVSTAFVLGMATGGYLVWLFVRPIYNGVKKLMETYETRRRTLHELEKT